MTASSISALKQLAYVVSDVPRAVAFFQQLGLPLLFQPSAQLAFIAVGSVRLMLTQPQGAGIVGQNSVLYLQCQQIEAEYQRLLAADIVSEQSPHCVAQMGDYDLWLAFFRDPDGNLLALLEEKVDETLIFSGNSVN